MRVFSRLPSKERFKAYVTTTEAWVLPKEESAIAPENIWTNRDLDPVPEGMRTWTPTTFVLYWMSDLVSAGTWAAVAGLIALGLTWWECVLAVLVGGTMVALVITGECWASSEFVWSWPLYIVRTGLIVDAVTCDALEERSGQQQNLCDSPAPC
jgi:cytosine/uracil/thiamine/allantoin permease